MRREDRFPLTPRMEAAIAEMKLLILAHYPTATFSVYEWDDPDGIFLDAVVDTDDLEAVTELYVGRMVDMQVEEGMPLFVVPSMTPERKAAMWEREARGRAALLIP